MTRNAFFIVGFALILALLTPALLLAEKAPEHKDAAEQVVTAEVMGVYSKTVEFDFDGQSRERIEYVIELAPQEVHRGTKATVGERFYVHCFDVVPVRDDSFDPPRRVGIVGMNGHDGLPQEGQMIKAYSRHQHGTNNGLYPKWFDVIEADKKAESK